MDDDTLVGSSRSPHTSPRSASTLMSPKTLLGGSPGTARRRPWGFADVVSELKRSNEAHAAMGEPSGIEEHEPPAVDEKQQNASAELFYHLEKRIETLDKRLRDFENASRELGGSVGIVSSSFRLQERLGKILFLFRENAACLFPRKISRKPHEKLVNPNLMERQQDWRNNHSTVPMSHDNLELDMLPAQLESFAKDVSAFMNCLNEFEEFNDEAISQSMRAFEGDLRYFSSCLSGYKNQFRSPPVQRYVHDLTIEISGHLDDITGALNIFIEIGIPTIWYHQQHAVKNLLNVSTLSIVFGVVDASLLVCSSKMTGSILGRSVNMFWLASLVFSIGGGVNGLLGLTWKQSICRSPVHRVPWWLLVWMKGSPLVFLVIAIACFSAGVVLFMYSSGQHPITSAFIVVLTLIASSGLIFISGWFVLERWTFVYQTEQKWLEEVIYETLDDLAELGIVRAHRVAIGWCSKRIAATRVSFNRLLNWVSEARKPKSGHATHTTAMRGHSTDAISTENPSSSGCHKADTSSLDVRDPKQRFQNAVRAVIKLQKTTGNRPKPVRPGLPRNNSWWQPMQSMPQPDASASPLPDPTLLTLRGTRVTKVIEELKALELSQELLPHGALIRHIQFSPNGKYLATSSWDRTAMIFRVGDELTHHRTLVHVRGFVSQVAWSPNGKPLLLTRFTRGIKLWTEEGVCKQTIDRSNTVSSVVWLPNGSGFLSVEGSDVVKLDPHGKVLDTYHLGRVRLINVAVTSDCSRLISVGPSISPSDRPQPTRHTKVEKRIIVYNMVTKRKENQTPLFDDVRDIVIAKKSHVILISFSQAPPQLWKLEIVRDRTRTDGETTFTARLNLKHTFAVNMSTSIAGSCYFGGRDEQFVYCVGKMGDVHIWDRETAALLRYLRPLNVSELRDMTCISWNNATDEPMTFATGSHDGALRVWSTLPYNRTSEGSTDVDSDQ